MKKIELGTGVYDKIFKLSEDVLKKVSSGDIEYIILSERLNKINEYSEKMRAPYGLLDSIVRHYIVFDYANGYINKISKTDNEIEILKTAKLGFFEVIDKKNDSIVFLNNSTNEKFEIVGEGMGSEKRLMNFEVGDLTISRIIKMSDGWYVLKNYFYFLGGDNDAKMIHRYLLNSIQDISEALERIYYINESANNKDENINYERRIKKLFGKFLTKNLEKELNKLLKKIDLKSHFEFEKFLNGFKQIDNKTKSDIKSLFFAYLDFELNKDKIDLNSEYQKRQFLVTQALFSEVGEKFNIKNTEKYSDERSKEIENYKNEWFEIPNILFSMQTPKNFLKEIKDDFDPKDIRMIQISEDELEFYDGYMKYFDDKEKEIYEKALKMAQKQESKACLEFGKLLDVHSDFFRLRANYIMTKYHYMIDKYMRKNFQEDISLEEMQKDRDFVDKIYDEIKYVKKLKKGYVFPNGFDKLVKDTQENLIMGMGIHSFHIPKDEAEKLIKSGEKEVIKYLESQIKDFNLDELIRLILSKSSFYVTWVYEDEGRFFSDLTGWHETKLLDLFEFLFYKHRKDGEIIFDDVEKIYDSILIIDKKDKHIWNFKKIIEFDEMIDKLLNISTKKYILEEFVSCIEVGDFIEPEYIYEKLGDFGYKDKFKKSINKIGYEWNFENR